MTGTRVLVTARERRGKALPIAALNESYAALAQGPRLALAAPHGATATAAEAHAAARLPSRDATRAFAALLHGLLEVSKKHRQVELRVEAPGEHASPFAQGVAIYRGAFDRPDATRWLDAVDAGERPEPVLPPGAEQIGNLGELIALLEGLPFAIAYAGAVYVPDGRESARRISPPGRFTPAAWSADGEELALLGATAGGEPSLWISRHGSGAVAAIALEIPGAATGAAFSPDGSTIAVTTASGRLAVMPADGHSSTAIPVAAKLRLSDPTWSPDGALVACVAGNHLHVVSVAEGRKGSRVLTVDSPPTDDDVSLADPEFSEDGALVYVRALVGEPRVPRLVRVALDKPGIAEPVGPRLSRVRIKGGASRWRRGRLFVAGIGEPGVKSADSEWLDPATGVTTEVPAPKHARLAFGAPDQSVVFVKRMKGATWLWRSGRPKKVRLPFPAWLTVP